MKTCIILLYFTVCTTDAIAGVTAHGRPGADHFFTIPVVAVHENIPSTGIPHDTLYALVAGGSRGIGFAIAEALAKRGYNLILIARGMRGLESAKARLEKAYPVHVELL